MKWMVDETCCPQLMVNLQKRVQTPRLTHSNQETAENESRLVHRAVPLCFGFCLTSGWRHKIFIPKMFFHTFNLDYNLKTKLDSELKMYQKYSASSSLGNQDERIQSDVSWRCGAAGDHHSVSLSVSLLAVQHRVERKLKSAAAKEAFRNLIKQQM